MQFHTLELVHFILSTAVLMIFLMVASSALLLFLQERIVRTLCLVSFLPSLERLECILFQLIGIGFFLLALDLITSLISFSQIVSHTGFLEKTLLSCLACFVFFMLLIGRRYLGWRGKIAIVWTLFGVSLIIFIYLGTVIFEHYSNHTVGHVR